MEHRCTGCGWCENKCPVKGAAAIRVNVIGEVRLASGSYVEKAREYGFEFKARDNSVDRLAPGTFETDSDLPQAGTYPEDVPPDSGLPPGFLPK
jgi:ferredoxin